TGKVIKMNPRVTQNTSKLFRSFNRSECLQIIGEFGVATLAGKVESSFSGIRSRVRVRSMRDQEFYNFQPSIGCGLQQWRMSLRVTVIHVCAIFGKPRRYGIVAASYGPG